MDDEEPEGGEAVPCRVASVVDGSTTAGAECEEQIRLQNPVFDLKKKAEH